MYRNKIALLLVGLSTMLTTMSAKVSQHTADSIAALLNGNVPPGCDASCSLYAAEHPGLGLTNTLFIAALVLLGTAWMYNSQKKKYILVTGILVALLIVGSYFAAPLMRSNTNIPESCPVIKADTKNAQNTFSAPGAEFATTDSSSDVSNDSTSNEFAADTANEFQSSEFDSVSSEFAAADISNQTVTQTEPDKPVNTSAIYEAIAIFVILGFISLFIRYTWFRKIRGLILLIGLVWLGFYRGGCPCMISGFQNGVLMLFGAPIHWESALWFIVLIPATYLFGRVWCGWLCHLGALQEFIFKSTGLHFLQSLKAQRILKIILIAVFVIWLAQLLTTHTNIYCDYDPFKVAFNLFSANTTGWVLMAVLLVSSVLIYRPFCRAVCPVGLVLGWVSYMPGAKKLCKDDSCISCKLCEKKCSERALIHENKATTFNKENCIMCGECISECNKKALNIKRKNSKTPLLTLLILFVAMPQLQAQWECPSRLGAGLKPIGSSNLMWATEITSSAGYAGNQGLANLMLFGGLDYSFGKNTLYMEGGVKNWMRFGSTENTSNYLLLGLREAYYKYSSKKNTMTLGLQSMKSDDDYLLNERVVGFNYALNSEKWRFNLLGGSVLKEFARNGTFCTVGYLYNITAGRERSILGNKLGQTNMAMLSLAYMPSDKSTNNEFSTDGLTEGDNKAFMALNSIGMLMYTEFGNWISTQSLTTGLFAKANVAGITLKPEILLQLANKNNALIYSFTADKQLEWNNGQMTRLFARYIGLSEINPGAIALNSFSNIFAGEVLRFDALDLPFLQTGIKHSFTKTKTSIKLQYSMQTGQARGFNSTLSINSPSTMKELDFSLSKNIGKSLLFSAHAGYLSYPSLENYMGYLTYITKNSPWGKVELRITF